MDYKILSGKIFIGDTPEIINGSIYIDSENNICEIKEQKNISNDNWIIPRFINAHTHIGDSIIKDPLLGIENKYTYTPNLDDLIKPPNGLKHKILTKESKKKIIKYMSITFKELNCNGISTIVDFREEGINGINSIKKAKTESNTNINTIILSRPKNKILKNIKNNTCSKREIQNLITNSDGFGISGSCDCLSTEELLILREYSNKNNKIFAIHSGEKNNKDIHKALELNPNILIHMTNSTIEDLKIVSKKNIPIIICPRSNFITGVGIPPIKEMLKLGITIGLGTDNVMLNSPNMFEELNILSKYFKLNDKTIYSIIYKNNRNIFNLKNNIEVGNKANLIILNSKSYNLSGVFNPLSGFIRRARIDDIIKIL